MLDGVPFVIGILTLLKQFNRSERDLFFVYIGQYLRAQIDILNFEKTKTPELPMEITYLLRFLQIYCKFANIDSKVLDSYVPSYLFARFGIAKK